MSGISELRKIKLSYPAKVASGIVVFFLLEYLLFAYVDRYVAAYTALLDSSDKPLIDFFRTITDLGKGIWYLIPCGVITVTCAFVLRGKYILPRYRLLYGYIGVRTFFLFATIGLSGIAADILKPIVGRGRPTLWLHHNIYGFLPFTKLGFLWNGMPSGHSTTVFALAFCLSYLYPRLRVIWFAYALLLAGSRIMVDAHYLSDVFAGAVLGWATMHLFLKYGMIHLSKVIFPIDLPVLRE
jgi:undecaprenyl-diphosphatase